MQEQKKGNRSMLQIAGPLLANPSNPASTACRLILQDARSRPMTGLHVSHRPVVAPLVTHFKTPVTLRHLLLQTPIFIHSPNLWRGSLLLRAAKQPQSQAPQSLEHLTCGEGARQPHEKAPLGKTGRGFSVLRITVRRRSWSCGSRSGSPLRSDRPGWRYHPGCRIRP